MQFVSNIRQSAMPQRQSHGNITKQKPYRQFHDRLPFETGSIDTSQACIITMPESQNSNTRSNWQTVIAQTLLYEGHTQDCFRFGIIQQCHRMQTICFCRLKPKGCCACCGSHISCKRLKPIINLVAGHLKKQLICKHSICRSSEQNVNTPTKFA